MISGAIWHAIPALVSGVWLVVVAVVAPFFHYPHHYLFLALAGGGAFIVLAIGSEIYSRRVPQGRVDRRAQSWLTSIRSFTPRPVCGSLRPSPRWSRGESISFPRLQEILDMTAGNLSTHLRKLEDAAYVLVTKTHQGKMPVTYLELTRSGRRAFEITRNRCESLLGESP